MNYYSYELGILGYEETDPLEFYRDVFPEGELATQKDDPADYETGKYSAIAVCVTNNKKANGSRIVKRYTITDELDNLDLLMYSNDFCFMSPISYAGKNRTSTNARFMYALCVEVDNLCIKSTGTIKPKEECYNIKYNKAKKRYEKYEYTGLHNLINLFDDKLPKPTYIVASGTGLHLYYIFKKAIPLFPNLVKEIEKYKKELTKRIWNKKVTYSYKTEDIQFESIFQGFRIPGTLTKVGLKTNNRRDDVATVHKTGDVVDVEYLNLFVPKNKQMNVIYKSNLTLKDAQKLYPDWYDRRIVNGEKKGHWTCSENVYNWWYNRIKDEARVGHRYYCLMMLCIYAIKCNITLKQLEDDCFSLLSDFEKLTDDENNHFTEKDIIDALQAYENKDFVTYPINSIQNRSGLHIEKNKRNYRKQKAHIEYMNQMRDFKLANNECLKAGRPKGTDKSEIVKKWQADHPNGKKAQCIRETGLAKHTVYKWWNDGSKNDNADDDIQIIDFDY